MYDNLLAFELPLDAMHFRKYLIKIKSDVTFSHVISDLLFASASSSLQINVGDCDRPLINN